MLRRGFVIVLAGIGAAGCGHTPTACGGLRPCSDSRVCGFDGQCGSVPRASAAPEGARRLPAIDWGGTSEGSRPLSRTDDLIALGGSLDAVVHLRFGPLPAADELERAVLAVAPAEGDLRDRAPPQVVAYPTYPFEGATLARQGAPGRRGAFRVARGVAPTAGRMLRLDVTEPARAAARRDGQTLYLAIQAVGKQAGAPWHLASPRATDASRRPALELVLQ